MIHLAHILRQARRFVFAVLLSIDLLASALTGGGDYESISARLGRGRRRGLRSAAIAATPVDWVARAFFGQRDHCRGALEAYEARLAATAEIG